MQSCRGDNTRLIARRKTGDGANIDIAAAQRASSASLRSVGSCVTSRPTQGGNGVPKSRAADPANDTPTRKYRARSAVGISAFCSLSLWSRVSTDRIADDLSGFLDRNCADLELGRLRGDEFHCIIMERPEQGH
jgi:hypothetical protein